MRFSCSSPLRCALLAACTFILAVHVFAQATTASIHGTVTDASGAAVPNATVNALNTSTGISVTQRNDSKGYFNFPELHIGGPYSITVEDPGFRRFVANGIMLDLSSSRDIDARLQLGSSSETIQVNSAQVAVETSDVQLKNVIAARDWKNCPRSDAMPSNCRRLPLV